MLYRNENANFIIFLDSLKTVTCEGCTLWTFYFMLVMDVKVLLYVGDGCEGFTLCW